MNKIYIGNPVNLVKPVRNRHREVSCRVLKNRASLAWAAPASSSARAERASPAVRLMVRQAHHSVYDKACSRRCGLLQRLFPQAQMRPTPPSYSASGGWQWGQIKLLMLPVLIFSIALTARILLAPIPGISGKTSIGCKAPSV